MSTGLEPQLLARAFEAVAARTGFRDTAISTSAVERVLLAELARGQDRKALLAQMLHLDSELVHALVSAVLVGETYFFRHPEQFHFVASEVVPAAVARATSVVRGWSAGCASGEEAYSIAACLLATVPQGVGVEVLGTDLHEGRLAQARKGLYGAWSRREAGPHLFPLYRDSGERQVSIHEHVRAVTQFAQGNLLEPLPESFGRFDVIFCRNVLTYFSHEAQMQALLHLAQALVPGGFVLLGTVEVDQPPAGLVRVGSPELQAFCRQVAVPRPRPPSPPVKVRPPPPPPPAPPPPAPSPVQAHTEALQRIEHGDEAGAAEMLRALLERARDYLPGMLELALLRERSGARQEAQSLMREVRERAGRLPPDQLISGPEPLPARFYRASADAYLTLGAIE